MKEFILPNWSRSNLNISATLAEFLGAPNKNDTLPILKTELGKNYKNIVFICFDGLGINPININLDKDDIIRKNIMQILVSTFPSTTTNATTSLMVNKLPLEHGWFGWSMNFKEINRNVNIYLNTDSYTNEKLEIKNSPLGELNYYFDNATKNDYEISTVLPNYVKVKRDDKNTTFSSLNEFSKAIINICDKQNKQLIYAYYPEPDTIMHEFGVTSNEAKKVITDISNNVKYLYESTKDTLFIITADHGQIDVEGYVEFYNDKKLNDMLEIYPFLDSRAPAFIVKKNMCKEFEDYFVKTYGEDFELHKSSELIENGYFGKFGDKGYLLGDYIAIGTFTHKQALFTPNSKRFKGHHTSLTEEMEVPLILLKN